MKKMILAGLCGLLVVGATTAASAADFAAGFRSYRNGWRSEAARHVRGPYSFKQRVEIVHKRERLLADNRAKANQNSRLLAQPNSRLTRAERSRINAANVLVAGQRAYRPNTLRTRSYVPSSRRVTTITPAQLASRGSRLSGLMR